MKDQAQMKNQSQMMSMGQPLPIMSQSHQVMNNQNSQMLMNQLINPSHMMINQSQSQGMLNNRGGGYGMWPPPQVDQLKFKNPNTKPSGFMPSSSKAMGPRNNKNWKGKKGNDKRNNNNWKELPVMGGGSSINNGNVGGGGTYNPPTLKELQQQNRLKARRYFSKKKFNHGGKSAPFAPRNTTSFLIRAKKAGGITSLVSPCPVTPAVLPTPNFSPSREVLVDMAKEEWGVDGYGSMKGLIRLRSPGNEADVAEDEEDEEGGSSESDVEEHLEVERRLDHDLSRFEMIYPNYGVTDHGSYHLENRVDDQDTHIAQLEEENLILKERLFLMEREFDNLRTRLQSLERQRRGAQGFIEEVVENDSEHESESRGYGRSVEENMEENNEGNQYAEAMKYSNREVEQKESNDTEKGGETMEECINKDKVVKGVADVDIEDDVLRKEEDINVGLGGKMEDDDGTIEVNPDSSKVEGSVPIKDETETETVAGR
ncbi:uncharacterized protein LOC112520733 [Cynara cardunculus var. scolymus]|uniref:PRLI-interacting factor A n=1 Tax=Cynara cardunculus var. scolymus TaxID=59895 RepID=A0A124SBJ8_CYNCS|nr:uncharacterized protein LOC112520733 [Cynara cardunculus var. scolymus]KVH90882.1 hypothetical protein Ccrd_007139 [Cynara cardunculus var. scolymus]